MYYYCGRNVIKFYPSNNFKYVVNSDKNGHWDYPPSLKGAVKMSKNQKSDKQLRQMYDINEGVTDAKLLSDALNSLRVGNSKKQTWTWRKVKEVIKQDDEKIRKRKQKTKEKKRGDKNTTKTENTSYL